jgi:hypothetical protein
MNCKHGKDKSCFLCWEAQMKLDYPNADTAWNN